MSTFATTTITSTCSFTNNSGALFNPTTVTATVVGPTGVSATYTTASAYPPATITNPSTGAFVLKLDCSIKGTYKIAWYGADANGKITHEVEVWVS